MVTNVHQRIVPGTPAEVWKILTNIGALYPTSSGSFELPDGIYPGAPVIHDGTRYTVQVVDAPRRLWFDVSQLGGGHGFELSPVGDRCTLVRHSLGGRLRGSFIFLWHVYVRWAHDKAVEGLLENLAAAMTLETRGPTGCIALEDSPDEHPIRKAHS